jgi:hypothetical protein
MSEEIEITINGTKYIIPIFFKLKKIWGVNVKRLSKKFNV